MADKKAISSTTIQGAVVAGIPALDTLLVFLGVFESPMLAPIAATAMGLFGSVMAIIGRIKATKKIKLF